MARRSALKTIKAFTGLDIDHVVIVDFQRFKELIDRIGGVDVYVPHAIHSNRFDCPLKPAKCATWTGWHFEKGTQHMDGRRALAYSRVRENQLDPADNDITRGERQQAVAQAITDKLAGVGYVPPIAVRRRRPPEAARHRPRRKRLSASSAG